MTSTKTRTRRPRRGQHGIWTPVFDYMLALLGIFLIIAITEKPKSVPMRIDTLGEYAVVLRWPDKSNDDVDLYLQNPQGAIAWFGSTTEGMMRLEGDDLGCYSGTSYGTGTGCKNFERTLVTGVISGEYTANVHMYMKSDRGPTRVTCELWRLRGSDRQLLTKHVVLVRAGEEQTCFRFTLNHAGHASNFNTLPKRFIGQAVMGQT